MDEALRVLEQAKSWGSQVLGAKHADLFSFLGGKQHRDFGVNTRIVTEELEYLAVSQ